MFCSAAGVSPRSSLPQSLRIVAKGSRMKSPKLGTVTEVGTSGKGN